MIEQSVVQLIAPILPRGGRRNLRRLGEGALRGRCVGRRAPSTIRLRRTVPLPSRGGFDSASARAWTEPTIAALAEVRSAVVSGDETALRCGSCGTFAVPPPVEVGLAVPLRRFGSVVAKLGMFRRHKHERRCAGDLTGSRESDAHPIATTLRYAGGDILDRSPMAELVCPSLAGREAVWPQSHGQTPSSCLEQRLREGRIGFNSNHIRSRIRHASVAIGQQVMPLAWLDRHHAPFKAAHGNEGVC